MYSNDAITHGKIKWRALLICWLIILAGYLMIRMVFLVFGLQLYTGEYFYCKGGLRMYQALYRKWRPKTFADVVGQEQE